MGKCLILGYWGVGKTTLVESTEKAVDLTDITIIPSLDILHQYWADPSYDVVMADPNWEKVIIKSGIPFYVVIPTQDRLEEFIQNFQERYKQGKGGGDLIFCTLMKGRWKHWLDKYKNDIACVEVIELPSGQWLKDAIEYINNRDNYEEH